MSIRFTEDQLADYQKRLNSRIASSGPATVKPKPSKYGNHKVTIDGIKFDSKREGEHYRQLKMLEAAGRISNLTLQPSFELAPAVTIQGKKKRALTYRADFQYTEKGKIVVVDVKGMKTDVYILKRHLMKSVLGIDILEI